MLAEQLVIFTLLGIRFWDPVMDRAITDALDVRAYPQTAPRQERLAFRTASGNYAFQGLPGLQHIEYPETEHPETGEGGATSPPTLLPFVVTVADQQQRYLPAAFAVDLPLPYRGLYQVTPADSPPGSELAGFYLFAAPTRPTPPGFGVIRAHVVDADSGSAAAHAIVIADFGEEGRWLGMSNSQGGLLILFPYPTFRQILHTSPPGSLPANGGSQRWPLTIRALYAPNTLTDLPGTDLPDFRSISSQEAGLLWPDQTGPPVAQLDLELTFGQELVLRTEGISSLLLTSQ
jgi:hypothetical protein